MIRIFAKLDSVSDYYYTMAPVEISLNPFPDDCYYLDLEDNMQYKTVEYETETSSWKPYNITLWEFYVPKTDRYYYSDDEISEDSYYEEVEVVYRNGIKIRI